MTPKTYQIVSLGNPRIPDGFVIGVVRQVDDGWRCYPEPKQGFGSGTNGCFASAQEAVKQYKYATLKTDADKQSDLPAPGNNSDEPNKHIKRPNRRVHRIHEPRQKSVFKSFEEMTIGQRIRYLLDQMGVTQTALAEKIGVKQSAISNLMTDSSRKPNAFTLMILSMAFHCHPDWILTGHGDRHASMTMLNTQERTLMEGFKTLRPDQQQAILGMIQAMRPTSH